MALTRRALGGLTIGGSAAFTLAACGGNEGGSDSNAEVVWAIDYAWESWNENTSTGNNSSGARAMRPMNPAGAVGYDFDTDGNVFHDDAIFAGPPELVAEAPMTVKIPLNENAQWSDGESVRLEDFLFYWYGVSGKPEHANQEKAIPAYTGWGENVASITQDEDGSIVFTFVEGYIDPEWQFNAGIYLPSHVAEAEGFAAWQTDPEAMGDAVVWFNENLWDVVVGPYKPVDWKLGEYIKYELNENYQGSIKPTVEKLTMTVVDGTAAVVTELRQGTIAGSQPGDFSIEEFEKLDENEALTYEAYSGATWSHFDVNVKGKFLQDQALRQAVFTVINIDDITGKIFPGTEVPRKGNHIFSEGSPNYVDYAGEAGYGTGDIDAAKQILTDAGYTWDGDALVSPDGEPVMFNFRFSSTSESRKLTGEILQAQIQELGVALELKGFADDEFAAVLTAGEFDIIVFSWVGDPAFTTGPQQFFKSGSESNYGQFSDPDVDAAIDLVRSTYDLDESAGFANEVSRMAIERAWTLPLYDSPLAVLHNTEMLGNIGPNRYSQVSSEWNLREWTQP